MENLSTKTIASIEEMKNTQGGESNLMFIRKFKCVCVCVCVCTTHQYFPITHSLEALVKGKKWLLDRLVQYILDIGPHVLGKVDLGDRDRGTPWY